MNYEKLSDLRKQLQAEGSIPSWYTTGALQAFRSSYMVDGEDWVNGRMRQVAHTLANHLGPDLAEEWEEKFFNIMWRGWFSPATPVLANTGTTRGLNVSCSGGAVSDSIEGFYDALQEQAILTKHGFGCSGDFSGIRSRGTPIRSGGTASGVVPVIEDFRTMTRKVSQGQTRRGATACYLDIEHGDFDELLDLVEIEPDGLNIGWNIHDTFVEKLVNGDGEALRRFQRALYAKLVVSRGYFTFIDKINRASPKMYQDKGLLVNASNLCNEVRLYSDDGPRNTFEDDEGGHTFTCVLSSMNAAKYDEWKDTDAVFIAHVFLDCVVSDFLKNSYGVPGLERAHRFTRKSRPTGLGLMGLHTYFQSKMVPFESLEAHYIDDEIFKKIHDDTLRASQWLAEKFGEPEWCVGYGVRNTHRTALAPTKSTAGLMGGVSESIGPEPAMVWTQTSASGDIARISPEFLKLLKSKNLYNDEIINSIIENVGSCQHLTDVLTDEEREVFKTGFEISQEVILNRAAHRQQYLCQGQSLNLYVSEDGDEDRIAALHTRAFLDENIHGLYYIYSRSGVVVSSVCSACEA